MTYRVIAKIAPAQLLCFCFAALLIVVGLFHLGHGYGDQLPDRSLTLAHGTASTVDTYQLNFSLPQAQTLGSIKLQFCSEGPLLGTPCTAPAGFSAAAETVSNQSGETGFTVSNSTQTIILTRTPVATTATNLSYTFSGITNPSNDGTFYARLQTFSTNNATGIATDDGGLALSIASSVSVSATVPPYLYFCVGTVVTGTDCSTATGSYINFGNFTPVLVSTAETQMVAGTNGPTGYAITANGTTLTSGINIIPAIATPDVSRPGTSQFGLNLRANNDPTVGQEPDGQGVGLPTTNYNTPNRFSFVPGDVVASNPVPDYPRRYTSSYIANVSKNQEPGVYVSTLTYVATAGF